MVEIAMSFVELKRAYTALTTTLSYLSQVQATPALVEVVTDLYTKLGDAVEQLTPRRVQVQYTTRDRYSKAFAEILLSPPETIDSSRIYIGVCTDDKEKTVMLINSIDGGGGVWREVWVRDGDQ